MNVELAFMEEMQRHGLDPSEIPCADGEFHRIHDRQDKPGKIDLWYVLHDNGLPVGIFGHWSRLPETRKWHPKLISSLTPEARLLIKKLYEQKRVTQELAKQQLQAECRTRSAMIHKAADEANPCHTYLTKKHVKPYGIKQLNDKLIIPLYKCGILTGLQIITPDGKKRFLKHTEKAGAYFSIPGCTNTICIAEGYATAATIHELTGNGAVVAFDCWNLKAVAIAFKATHPDNKIIICADNDRLTTGNPGLTKAREAALAIGAKLAIPTFPGDEGTDFNDLFAICGAGGTPCLL